MFEYTLKLNEKKPLDHLPVDSQQLIKNATTLMEIFKEAEESVFLLDGSWGSGKTTLVRAWMKYLEGNKNTDKPAWKTIYVDAYQNDFNDDPLLAIGEGILSLQSGQKALKESFASLLTSKWTRAITATGLVPGGEIARKALEELLQPDETLADRIQKFRRDLKNLKSLANDRKVVIFIDELDRCRPTYAIEMLEKVKHIFSVNGALSSY